MKYELRYRRWLYVDRKKQRKANRKRRRDPKGKNLSRWQNTKEMEPKLISRRMNVSDSRERKTERDRPEG